MVPMLGGRFQLSDLLASGDIGMVWRALDRGTGRTVAVKVLHPHLAADPRLADRFLRARRELTALWHPGIARLLEVVVDDDALALVSDLVEGADLHRWPAMYGPMTASSARDIAESIADALAAAHRVGMVHGDIKPSNVVIPPPGAGPARLTDFSVAVLIRAGRRTPEAGQRPWYRAPEVTDGVVPAPSSDLYSFGAVLTEMFATASWSRDRDCPLVLPVREVALACMAHDPALRPTAADVCRVLREGGSGTRAAPGTGLFGNGSRDVGPPEAGADRGSNGAGFAGTAFGGADLTGAHFTGTDFTGAEFSGADFTGGEFSASEFSGAGFSGAEFGGLARDDFGAEDFGRDESLAYDSGRYDTGRREVQRWETRRSDPARDDEARPNAAPASGSPGPGTALAVAAPFGAGRSRDLVPVRAGGPVRAGRELGSGRYRPPDPRPFYRRPVGIAVVTLATLAVVLGMVPLVRIISGPPPGRGTSGSVGARSNNGQPGAGQPGNAASGPASASGRSVRPPAAPRLPSAATARSQQGGGEFVRYYFSALNNAESTGDTSEIARLASAGCNSCQTAVAAIRASYANGGAIRGGTYLVRRVTNSSLWTIERPLYDATIDRTPRSSVDRAGVQQASLAPLTFANCTMVLEWTDDGWRLLDVLTAGCVA